MQSPIVSRTLVLVLLVSATCPAAVTPAKEFLTPKEIERIQDTQEIEGRVKIYLEAAALRLKTAEERLNGKESEPGDPLEFFSTDEMLDGYYQILKSVMMNLDTAAQSPGTDQAKLGKALKNLKDSTARAAKSLAILKKMAEEKKLEETWNLVNQAVEITEGARQGAEAGSGRYPAAPEKRKQKP
jgi:hypothetical protein